jgi:hypothetical protein
LDRNSIGYEEDENLVPLIKHKLSAEKKAPAKKYELYIEKREI